VLTRDFSLEEEMKKNHINKKIKGQKMKRPVIILILAGIIIFALIIFFTIRAYNHYTELENHKNYFRQPNATIQDWMTIRSIVRHYNLTESEIYTELNVSPNVFVRELGIDNSTLVDRITIQTICVKKHLDCNVVLNRLNSIRAK
jgi:hypothetical protein